MPKTQQLTWTLDYEKTTPGTMLFRDPDDRKRTLYIKKDECKELGIKEGDSVQLTISKGE